jgi:membrane protease subunit HflK
MGHDHDHPHEHGPGCGCGHEHDHDHGHGDMLSHRRAPSTSVTPPETPLDPGSQALATALKSSFGIVKVVMVLLLLVFLGSGFFTVGPQERAVILRFGRPLGEGEKALRGPGAHFALPYPIDEVVKVPITELQRVTSTVGWFFITPEQEVAGTEPMGMPSLNPGVDGYVVTADQNIIHARATLTYRIEDPVRFVFGFTGDKGRPFSGATASNLVLNALNTALVQSAAQFKVDDILTRDVFGFKDAVKRRTAELVAVNQLGVVVEQLEVSSRPPLFLKADFARVTDAVQKRDKVINEARTIENQVLSKAGADAAGLTNAAASEAVWLVENLKAEASRFNDLLPKYRENPRLFTQLRLTETMGHVMTNVQDKIFLSDSPDGKTRELRLLLNREPQKMKRENATP